MLTPYHVPSCNVLAATYRREKDWMLAWLFMLLWLLQPLHPPSMT